MTAKTNRFYREPMPMFCARRIEVIETTLSTKGKGDDKDDPIRVIRQYWSLDGELLAELDPLYEKGEGK